VGEFRRGAAYTPQTQGDRGIQQDNPKRVGQVYGGKKDVYCHMKHPSINCPPYTAFYGRTDILYYSLPGATIGDYLLDKEEAPSFDEYREQLRDTTEKFLDKTADGMIARAQKKGIWEPVIGEEVWLLKRLRKKTFLSNTKLIARKEPNILLFHWMALRFHTRRMLFSRWYFS